MRMVMDFVPWWKKSKHPSIQSRSSLIATSSCGSIGHWPGSGMMHPTSGSILGAMLDTAKVFLFDLAAMQDQRNRLLNVAKESGIYLIIQ